MRPGLWRTMFSKTLREILRNAGLRNLYFLVYGHNHIPIFSYLDTQIRVNTDKILLTYGKIRIRESLYFGILGAVREQELDAN